MQLEGVHPATGGGAPCNWRGCTRAIGGDYCQKSGRLIILGSPWLSEGVRVAF